MPGTYLLRRPREPFVRIAVDAKENYKHYVVNYLHTKDCKDDIYFNYEVPISGTLLKKKDWHFKSRPRLLCGEWPRDVPFGGGSGFGSTRAHPSLRAEQTLELWLQDELWMNSASALLPRRR